MNVPDQLFRKLDAAATTGLSAQFPVYVMSGPKPRVGGAANVLLTVTTTDTNEHI